MRRVGALFVTGVVLVGSAIAGCATSEPVGRAGASAPPSPSTQADVESGAATPEPSLSKTPTSPRAPAQESTGNGATPRPESGTSPIKAPRPVGASLSELAAMVIDPFEETGKAGIHIRAEYPYQLANPTFTSRPWSSVPSDFGSAGPPPGFVVGYTRNDAAEDDEEEWEVDDRGEYLERGKYAPSLYASVWAFDSKAHAREYVENLAPNILDQADQPVRAALPAAGDGAVLWRSGSGRHFKDLALIRRGTSSERL